MSKFGRRLDRLDALCARPQLPMWWSDLLTLWRPSGFPAGEYGLRLAIRNNYLNFYRNGQSVARVDITAVGEPMATTHIKYVGESQYEPFGGEYITLREDGIIRGGKLWHQYEGIATLKAWIERIDGKSAVSNQNGYAGIEKAFVDQVVAENPNIIDLEMGLPAWGEQKTAPRMDIVEIEASNAGRHIVFWEAKRVSDGRMRCRAEVVLNEKPEVLSQLAAYRKFLTEEASHAGLVIDEYKNAAMLMTRLRAMADQLGKAFPLGEEIVAAATDPTLDVDPSPRLLVLEEEGANLAAWAPHAKKLMKAGVAITTIAKQGPFALRRSI